MGILDSFSMGFGFTLGVVAAILFILIVATIISATAEVFGG